MSFKYIMFNNGMQDIPIIFPSQLNHIDIAIALSQHESHKSFRLVSAGFVDIGLECNAYGDSDTLKISSRPEDGTTISMHPYLHGIRNHEMEKIVKKTFKGATS